MRSSRICQDPSITGRGSLLDAKWPTNNALLKLCCTAIKGMEKSAGREALVEAQFQTERARGLWDGWRRCE